jgi:hypothetical protein
MRSCQICSATGKRVIQNDYDSDLCLFECTSCGHRYVDGLVDQEWFDNYYLNEYRTDDAPYSGGRLDSLAAYVASYKPKSVLDIGGMDGELLHRLDVLGVKGSPLGVNGVPKGKFAAVILSHTLEHIYDIGAMFERVHASLKKGGMLFVEVPIHIYDNYLPPLEYDYHFQHINKFRPRDIETLFKQKGFSIVISEQIEDYREYKVWRIAGTR